MRLAHSVRAGIIAAVLAPTLTACSSSTDPTAPKALSTQEAQTVATTFFAQLFGAIGTSVGFVRNGPSVSRVPLSAETSAHASFAAGTTNAFTAPCPLGGKISGSFTESNNLDANGTGTVDGSASYTPTGCVVSTGSRNVTVDGAPSLTMRVTVPLVQYKQGGIATVRMGGGFSWAGGTCQIDYTITSAAAGHGTITGTVCGQTISGSI